MFKCLFIYLKFTIYFFSFFSYLPMHKFISFFRFKINYLLIEIGKTFFLKSQATKTQKLRQNQM